MRRYCRYKYQSPSSLRYEIVEGEIIGTVFNSKTNDEEFILQIEPESSYQEPYYTAAPIRRCRPIKKLSRNKTK
jgi:hypothetical protein